MPQDTVHLRIVRALLSSCLAALVVTQLAGCAIPATAKAPASAVPVAGQGTVLVRVSMVGLVNMNGFGVLARPVGKEETIEFNGWSLASEGYWTKTGTQDVKGQLVAAQLPAGSYEFFSFIALNSSGLAMGTAKNVKPFSYPFEVRQGEVTYLGEFHLKFEPKRVPKPGSSTDLSFQVLLRDNRTQDFLDAKKLIPDIRSDQIAVRLLGREASRTAR